MKYTVYEGQTGRIIGGHFSFDCEPDDTDVAVERLERNIDLKDDSPAAFSAFENALGGDDVVEILNNLKEFTFISHWESKPSENNISMVPKRELFIDKYGFQLFHKQPLMHQSGNEKYNEEERFLIRQVQDGIETSLLNQRFNDLRKDGSLKQLGMHLNWDELRKLRDYLSEVLSKHENNSRK